VCLHFIVSGSQVLPFSVMEWPRGDTWLQECSFLGILYLTADHGYRTMSKEDETQ
jgi:hypothetical protein